MAYDYQGAITAGANPDDVMNYMATQTGYRAQDAIKAGANQEDVLKHMSTLTQTSSSVGSTQQSKPVFAGGNGQDSIFADTPQAKAARESSALIGPQEKAADISSIKENASGLVSDWQKRANNIASVFQDTYARSSNGDNMVGGGNTIGSILTGGAKIGSEAVSGVIGDTLSRGMKTLTDIISNNPTLQSIAGSKGIGAVLDTVSGAGEESGTIAKPVIDAISNWEKQNPKVSSFIRSIGSIATNVAGIEAAPEAGGIIKSTGSELLNTGGKVIDNTLNTAGDTLSSIKNTVSSLPKNDLQTIADTISPKLTPKEIKLAESQGRIVTGKEPSLLRGGTPDQILSSDKVTESAFTVNREIPGAAQMSQPDLYTALEGRTTDMAQKLQPEMAKVPIKVESAKNLQTDWESLKTKQMYNADATDEANILKQQNQFETRIDKIIQGKGNLNDVWQERINYDNSIPSNVKNANSLSDSKLQLKKEVWLQNRKLLNDVINDSENGMGKTSQGAFKDMSNMYEAKTNLLSKAKDNFEATAQPSKITQWMKANPWKSAAIVGGITSATGVPGKIIRTVTGL